MRTAPAKDLEVILQGMANDHKQPLVGHYLTGKMQTMFYIEPQCIAMNADGTQKVMGSSYTQVREQYMQVYVPDHIHHNPHTDAYVMRYNMSIWCYGDKEAQHTTVHTIEYPEKKEVKVGVDKTFVAIDAYI